MKLPIRYLPIVLSKRDKKKQLNLLKKSRKLYKQQVFYTRKKLHSYTNKPSQHVKNALRIYNIESLQPNSILVSETGCSLSALKKIVNKGEGAYYSSGSRPNQTPQSWGYARLASSLTSGKSAAVDFSILEKGCNHQKKAFLLAKKAKKKYNHGKSKTRKIIV